MSDEKERPPAVRKASDPRQVRAAERLERRRQERVDGALERVLSTVEGRIVWWDLIRRCGVYQSAFNTHGSLQSFNLGRQQIGLELIGEAIRVHEEGYELMEREARQWQRRELATIGAHHTRTSAEEGQDE